MAPTENSGALGAVLSKATVYEQSLAALVSSVSEELRAAKDRLATPDETEILQHRLKVLQGMRQNL